MKRPLHKDQKVIAEARAVLLEMKQLGRSLVYATVLTDDGFEVVRFPDAATDGRYAGMASSLQALCEAVAKELAIGTSQYVIIAAPDGHVVQLRVPDQPLVLSALFDTDETLGKALSTSRLSAEKLSGALAPVPS
jgi:hypothetical protein